jgi:hypothetical protein
VHVQRTLGRALDQSAHLTLHAPVAVRVDQAHVAEVGVRVETDRHRRAASAAHGGAALCDVSGGVGGAAARLRAHLDGRLEGLVPGARLGQADAVQHALRAVVELERLGIDQQQLLLEPDREVSRCAEPVVQGLSPSAARAAIRPNTSAPARPLA